MQGDRYRVTVNVQISQENYGGAGLSIAENTVIEASTFLELCEILAQFHKLAQTLKAKAVNA